MGIAVWPAASSLQGEPNTREGVCGRERWNRCPKGATASRVGSGIKPSEDGEANAEIAEDFQKRSSCLKFPATVSRITSLSHFSPFSNLESEFSLFP